MREETGKLIKEKTDLPAFETCASTGVQKTENRMQIITMFLRDATLPHFKIGYKGTTKKAHTQIFMHFFSLNRLKSIKNGCSKLPFTAVNGYIQASQILFGGHTGNSFKESAERRLLRETEVV